MADSGADRQRRSRAHRRGDHSLCDASRCDGGTVVTRDTASVPLRARGRRLWLELTADAEPDPAQRVLIEEACRIADRLDKLDAQLRGDAEGWLTLAGRDDETVLTVIVDKALAEARQQAVALKQILAEVRQAAAPARPTARPGGTPTKVRPAAATTAPEVSSGVADLGARIAERRAQAAG